MVVERILAILQQLRNLNYQEIRFAVFLSFVFMLGMLQLPISENFSLPKKVSSDEDIKDGDSVHIIKELPEHQNTQQSIKVEKKEKLSLRNDSKTDYNLFDKNPYFSNQKYEETMSVLKQLQEEEIKLKTAIAYEKLRKEQPVYLDIPFLHEKIAEHRNLLQLCKHTHKMKTIMNTNLQLANTLQKILSKARAKETTQQNNSEEERRGFENLLKKKKELEREISVKRRSIAETDEIMLSWDKCEWKKSLINTNDSAKKSIYEELERLNESCQKVMQRICLLSKIIRCLALISEEDHSDLVLMCDEVSQNSLENLEDIEALLENVCSINL
ncbi:uncharacterized protein CDAR_568251 [Caerostris darwini]|uniref:Uncharacterized protein n=1 Tax=Caerostris darwini TaxID=1538125 RepID=A0AAV4QR58_9ARAC|nr:uncharacterized protein CDAR_568251 [Caerostris darwini]